MTASTHRNRLGIVTGAGGGIGREIARLLAAEGTGLALIDIDRDRLDETVELLGSNTVARAFRTDVRSQAAVTATADAIIEFGGVPRLLINCAGRLGPRDKKVWQLSDEDWQAVFAVNLFGAVNTVRAFLPGMRATGRSGHIVNIASLAGLLPQTRSSAYGAAERALVAFTEALEHQLADEHSTISVSLVCPGAVPTNLNSALRRTKGLDSGSHPDWLAVEVVAQRVVAAIHRPMPYVFPHPDTRERLERYHRRLTADCEPSLGAATPDDEGDIQ